MKKGVFLLVVLAVLAGILLRWWNLGVRSLWFDEGYTHWVASLPAGELVRMIRYDFTPPLYFLIAHGWMGLFGDSEFALRSWSALVASLTVILVAVLAWKTTRNPWATALATLLCAVSEIQVEWGQTARAYATAAFVFVLAVWLLTQFLETGKRGWLLAHGVAAAALVYQHNVMWMFLAGLNLGALIWPGKLGFKGRLASIAVTDAIVLLLFLPWLGGFLQQLSSLERAYFTAPPTFWEFTHNLVAQSGIHLERLRIIAERYLSIHDPGDRLFRLGLFALAASLGVMALLQQDREGRRKLLALLAFAFGPILLAFLYSHLRRSIWVEKGFIPTSAIWPIILSASLVAAWPKLVRFAAGGALAILIFTAAITSISFVVYPTPEDWRGTIRWTAAHGIEGSAVAFVSPEGEMLYRYYTDHLNLPRTQTLGAPITYFKHNPPLTMTQVRTPEDLKEFQMRLAEVNPERLTLIQSYTSWSDPKGQVQKYLDEHWKLLETKDGGMVRARLYERQNRPVAATH